MDKNRSQREQMAAYDEGLMGIAVHKGSRIGPGLYETSCGRRMPNGVETWGELRNIIQFLERVAEVRKSGRKLLVCPPPLVCWECAELMPAPAEASEDPSTSQAPPLTSANTP